MHFACSATLWQCRSFCISRTAPCTRNKILTVFDDTLRKGLTLILNVDMFDDHWIQASLPVHLGGLGVRSAEKLAPSAFLASAASTFSLHNDILAGSILSFKDKYTSDATISWKSLSHAEIPPEPASRFQKVWDMVASSAIYNDILTGCPGDADQARLKATNSPHAGDWLNALPIASVGLRLSDEEIRVAVGYRLRSFICQPYQCVCGSFVDARGLDGLSFRKSAPRHVRHSLINDILWRAIKKAQVLACKEPVVGLSRSDGKRRRCYVNSLVT